MKRSEWKGEGTIPTRAEKARLVFSMVTSPTITSSSLPSVDMTKNSSTKMIKNHMGKKGFVIKRLGSGLGLGLVLGLGKGLGFKVRVRVRVRVKVRVKVRV